MDKQKRLKTRLGIYSYIFIGIVSVANVFAVAIVKAQDIATRNADNSKLIRTGLNRIWDIMLVGQDGNPTGTILATIIFFMNIVAFFACVFGVLAFLKELQSQGATHASLGQLVLGRFIPILLVFALINGGGVLLAANLLGLRNAAYNIDSKIAATAQRVGDVNRIAADYQGEQAALDAIGKKQKDCSKIPATVSGKPNPVLKNCLVEFQAVVDQQLEKGAIKSPNIQQQLRDATRSSNILLKAGAVILSATGDVLSKPFRMMFDMVLLGFGILFTLIVEISMLIMAIVSPIAVTMSLYSLKPIKEWLSKFAGLVIMKVSYTISIGSFQIFVDTVGGNFIDGFVTLAFGIGAPAIAILVCWQCGPIVGAGIDNGVMKLAAMGAKAIGGGPAMAAGKIAGALAAKGGSKLAAAAKTVSTASKALRR